MDTEHKNHSSLLLGDGTTTIMVRSGVSQEHDNVLVSGVSLVPDGTSFEEGIHVYSSSAESIDTLIRALERAKEFLVENQKVAE